MDHAALGPREWEVLRAAPWAVAAGVMMSDPSGPFGRRNELATLLAQVRQAEERGEDGELVTAVAAALAGGSVEDGVEFAGLGDPDRGDVPALVLDRCREVAQVLSDHVELHDPEGAAAFRRWLLALAAGVAAASKKGGVLGFGGEAVSGAEQGYLDQLAQELGPSGGSGTASAGGAASASASAASASASGSGNTSDSGNTSAEASGEPGTGLAGSGRGDGGG